jgi:hypothetical protein
MLAVSQRQRSLRVWVVAHRVERERHVVGRSIKLDRERPVSDPLERRLDRQFVLFDQPISLVVVAGGASRFSGGSYASPILFSFLLFSSPLLSSLLSGDSRVTSAPVTPLSRVTGA